MDLAGARLTELASLFGLVAPQTHEEYFAGELSYTWLSKQGRPHRIDYVLWPADAQLVPAGTTVDRSCDISGGTLDHFLVVSAAQLRSAPARALTKRRKPVCDQSLLSCP
eukprot:13566515-Alexandrium_andersonii.AAC.1